MPEQQNRLRELLDRNRESKNAGKPLSADEESEFEALVATELDGAARRTAAMASQELRTDGKI